MVVVAGHCLNICKHFFMDSPSPVNLVCNNTQMTLPCWSHKLPTIMKYLINLGSFLAWCALCWCNKSGSYLGGGGMG